MLLHPLLKQAVLGVRAHYLLRDVARVTPSDWPQLAILAQEDYLLSRLAPTADSAVVAQALRRLGRHVQGLGLLGPVLGLAPAVTLGSHHYRLNVLFVSLLFNDYRANSRLFLEVLRANRKVKGLGTD